MSPGPVPSCSVVSVPPEGTANNAAAAATPAQLPYGGQPLVSAGLGLESQAGVYGAGKLPYAGQPIQPVGIGADPGLTEYGKRERESLTEVV